jgi:heme/copper-type cytochrome/quinol oxidase subunit 2
MKKYILPVLAISFLIAAPVAFGATTTVTTFPMPKGTAVANIWTILNNALNWIFNIVIFIGAIMIVYAGFRYVTAAGNTETTKKALDTLIYALIGIGIALLAKGLMNIIYSFLIGSGSLWD